MVSLEEGLDVRELFGVAEQDRGELVEPGTHSPAGVQQSSVRRDEPKRVTWENRAPMAREALIGSAG